MVPRLELELAVGDVVRIGDVMVTVIDIEDGEVTFRIDEGDVRDDHHTKGFSEETTLPLPR